MKLKKLPVSVGLVLALVLQTAMPALADSAPQSGVSASQTVLVSSPSESDTPDTGYEDVLNQAGDQADMQEEDSAAVAEGTATPTADPTVTAEPTATTTPEPTATETPTDTPEPAATPTEIPTNTPEPTATATPEPTAEPTHVPVFTDVSSSNYFYTPVYWGYDNGILAGTSATTFSPLDSCKRAQIITYLWNVAGRTDLGTATFMVDVPVTSYFVKPVVWGLGNEVTSGYDKNHFQPDAVCTRAQAITMIYKVSKFYDAGKEFKAPDVSSMPFTDVKSTDYFAEAVAWGQQNGILAGTTPTTFSPGDNCTRAQIITYLHHAFA